MVWDPTVMTLFGEDIPIDANGFVTIEVAGESHDVKLDYWRTDAYVASDPPNPGGYLTVYGSGSIETMLEADRIDIPGGDRDAFFEGTLDSYEYKYDPAWSYEWEITYAIDTVGYSKHRPDESEPEALSSYVE